MSKRAKYGNWTEDSLKMAVAAYRNGDYGLNECARVYGVPKATVKRHADSKNSFSNSVKSFGRNPTFTPEMEKILADHILLFEERFFGLTTTDVRKLAFDVAEKYGMNHNFNKEKGIAGKKWFYAFMRRNPQLSLRQPEATSMARTKGFNRENVNTFFDLLEKTVDKYGITATSIFNVDESGFTTVQKRQQKIIAKKGKHQVGTITSGERGVNTTMVCAANAAGFFIPPMLIFKRKRKPQELGIGAPPGSMIEISDTGYINSELFVSWLKHFKSHINCNKDSPVLLLLDGHTTHSKNLAALDFACANGIIILQLPGHTTHRLQPLDVAFFAPLQTYFNQAQDKWLRQNVGKTISQYQIAALLHEAYSNAACVRNAVSAFRASGIWPVDRNVFSECDFAPSNALVMQNQQNVTEESTSKTPEDSMLEVSSKDESTDDDTSRPINRFKKVVCELSPLPKPSTSHDGRVKRKAQTAVVITDSPYKQQLEESKNKINRRKVKPLKKRLDLHSAKGENNHHVKSSWFCILCEKVKEEEMIQCMGCKSWLHTRCGKVKASVKKFWCTKCK